MEIANIQDPRELSPLVLAYVGDAVYELLTRIRILERGNAPVQKLHSRTVQHVCAAAQAEGFKQIESVLTEEELSIFRRGRNTHNNIPKNASPAVYRTATGLEALFGYLYLKGEQERIQTLYALIWSGSVEGTEAMD